MKRALSLILAMMLLMSVAAHAERMQMSILDGMLTVDAEIPTDTPEALPKLELVPHHFDADAANKILMDGRGERTEYPSDALGLDVSFGEGDGLSEYMLVECDSGRICYGSAMWETRLRDVMGIDDPMKDTLRYYPQDREVDGFPRADALKKAEDTLAQLGIVIGTHVMPTPRVLTIDPASYAVMLEDLSQADRQASIPRRYLEPYEDANSGYLILYNPALNGALFMDAHTMMPLAMFVSRRGVEYLETEFLFDVVGQGEPKPLMSAEDALKAAEPGMVEQEGSAYVVGNWIWESDSTGHMVPSHAERILLGYRRTRVENEPAGNHAVPVWEYTYPRAMWTREGTWQTRTFDNGSFLGHVYVNALTGKYIETAQN